MENLLVTGASGFVGQAVCRDAVGKGFSVRGAVRRSTILPASVVSETVGDIDGKTDWCRALHGVHVVVHLAARTHEMGETDDDVMDQYRRVNVDGTRRLAQCAAEQGVRRLIMVSSIKVNGEYTPAGNAFFGTDAPAPEDPYGQSKWEAEQVLQKVSEETGLEAVILRPPLLYGPGVKANFFRLMQLVDRGVPLPLGGVRNRRSLMGLNNFSDLILHCVNDVRAAGKTFTVCDGDDVSSAELIRRLSTALEKPVRLLPVPEAMMRWAGQLTGKSEQVRRLCSSLQVDGTQVRDVLGWNSVSTMQEEFDRMVAWYRSVDSRRR